MKPWKQILINVKDTTLCILLLALPVFTQAQLPDCSSGTVMYSIWNDSLGSSVAVPSQIRSVNYTTGAVGPLMGGTSFMISKTYGSSTYYGSAALGVDLLTNRFYVTTQMASNANRDKDIITINTVTNTRTVIGTTPPIVGFHHIVKLGMASNGYGYAIGVGRDTTLQTAATFNPLIRFTTCGGSPSLNCSTIELLGYLAPGPNMTRYDLFNGDIAFDNAGNLYFVTASYGKVGSLSGGRYKDARMFMINAADIPTVAGTGTIPMTLLADYNSIDSSVVNGIAFDPAGRMYIATRVWNGPQPNSTFQNNMFRSPSPGVANEILSFGPKPVGFSIADVGSCYFPLTILANEQVQLNASNIGGKAVLKFSVFNNVEALNYELMRSEGNAENFEVIGTVRPKGDKAEASYQFTDPETTAGVTYYYRVRSVMHDKRIYSNVVKLSFSNNLGIALKPWPNPFQSQVEFKLETKAAQTVTIRVIDEQGRLVKSVQQSLQRGANKVVLNNLSSLKKGIYILEVAGTSDKVMEKIMKF